MDFPMEILATIGTGIVGFLFKAQANAMDALRLNNELQIKANMTADQLATSAAERSSPVARKVLAYIVIGGIMLGLLGVGIASFWNPDAVVSIIDKAPQKQFLWGLFKWGGGNAVTEAHGFVLPSFIPWVVASIIGFFMGTGAAKPNR